MGRYVLVHGAWHTGNELAEVAASAALARLMRRIEREPAFVRRLAKAVRRRSELFRPARELAAWRRLLAGLPGSRVTTQ